MISRNQQTFKLPWPAHFLIHSVTGGYVQMSEQIEVVQPPQKRTQKSLQHPCVLSDITPVFVKRFLLSLLMLLLFLTGKIMSDSSSHVVQLMYEVSVVHKRSLHSSCSSLLVQKGQVHMHEVFKFPRGGIG